MELTYAWLLVLTCANIGLLGLVVYAIVRPNKIRKEFEELFGGVQALSSIVARLDGQLSVLFDPSESSPVAEAPKAQKPARKTARKTARKPAVKKAA